MGIWVYGAKAEPVQYCHTLNGGFYTEFSCSWGKLGVLRVRHSGLEPQLPSAVAPCSHLEIRVKMSLSCPTGVFLWVPEFPRIDQRVRRPTIHGRERGPSGAYTLSSGSCHPRISEDRGDRGGRRLGDAH